MNDLTWTSRLVIWIAAVLLFVEAVIGRSIGVLTALAICAMAAALIAFLFSLSPLAALGAGIRESSVGPAPLPVAAQPVSQETPAAVGIAAGGDDEPTAEAVIVEPTDGTPGVGAAHANAGGTAERAEIRPTPQASSLPAAAPSRPPRLSVATVIVGPGLVGSPCPQCQRLLQDGQVAAVCPVCDTPHHASCWVEHRFHCAREGCSGHGALQEPDAR